MESAIFDCPSHWRQWLPQGVRSLASAEELRLRHWSFLALTPAGAALAGKDAIRCQLLLIPGNGFPPNGAETVISYGLSCRDSLTLSSLREPVLCVQRTLPRPDGTVIEPQEFPLPSLPAPAEELLPLLGLRLLRLPVKEALQLW